MAHCLKGNEIILLEGNLGSGKTTFTKFLVKALGGDENEVNSPTFTIMNEYETPKHRIFHIDLYRVDSFDITDFVNEGIIVIEWPKEDYSVYNLPVLKISFSVIDDISRKLTVKSLHDADYILYCLSSSNPI